jgi:uncharacterized protein YdbL (DUF1318 family)
MSARRSGFAMLVFAALAVFGLARPGAALELDAAKQQGLVGEGTDGYVAAVAPNPPVEVASLVATVNAKRKATYAEIAQKNGTRADDVAVLAAKKLIDRAPSGLWVRDAGRWYQKK